MRIECARSNQNTTTHIACTHQTGFFYAAQPGAHNMCGGGVIIYDIYDALHLIRILSGDGHT